jgi:hypothetical protein
MKKLFIFVLFIIFAFILNPFLSPFAASAEEKSCYFLATMGDVYVSAHEKDPGGTSEISVWNGTIKNGQEQLIKCTTGKVYYNYKPVSEDRSYGDNQASCQNGSIIRVP